jgi:hypothetical protein
MSGKLPIDRVRESRDAPRIREAERQRYTESQAALRDAGEDDPVAGARPPATEEERNDEDEQRGA